MTAFFCSPPGSGSAMTFRQTVPLFRLPFLLAKLSQKAGFMALGSDRLGVTRYSALPVRTWTLPASPAEFRKTTREILSAHEKMMAEARQEHSGAIAGCLFYEAGRATLPGFCSHQEVPLQSGFIGQYLWHLTVPRNHSSRTPPDAELVFHPCCPQEIRADVLSCLDTGAATDAPGQGFRLTRTFAASEPAETYRRDVRRILDLIHAGDCYQANLSQQFEGRYEGRPYLAWAALCEAIPVPHNGYLDAGEWQVLSVSPELFLEIRERQVTSKPIKGTRPRSDDPAQDAELARSLVASPKDTAENLMIVDLIRNDLSRFCEPFSVRVPVLFQVESYRNVHQLVSTVSGRLKEEITPYEAMLSAFPGGSITGAPKRRAMEVIDQLEAHRRGPYCGSLFWWGSDDSLDSNIAIRTLQTWPDGLIRAWAGCGIVADSDPEEEFQESLTKIRQLLTLLNTPVTPPQDRPV